MPDCPSPVKSIARFAILTNLAAISTRYILSLIVAICLSLAGEMFGVDSITFRLK